MPLVDYGPSDESESEENDEKNEDEETEVKGSYTSTNGNFTNKQPDVSVKEELSIPNDKLFSNLPTPKSTFSIPDNTFKLLNKKQPVRIVLPSLSEIDKSVDEKDQSRKPKPSTKGSGLFALLPAPKNSKALIPDSVKNKAKPTPQKALLPKQQLKPPIPSQFLKKSKKPIKDEVDDDDDNDALPESFFFTSTDDVQPDPIEPIDLPSLTPNNTVDNAIGKSPAFNDMTPMLPENSAQVQLGPSPMEVSNDVTDLEAEAIEKLCGARARKRKGDVPEEIIDINVDSMVGDAYMWLSKDLTKEREHGNFKKAKNLSVTERRKHQITYLASQAKEKEMELRNQWANSRMTRQQTQSKYGF